MLQDSNGALLVSPYIFPIFFITLWSVISYVVSMFSGWITLSYRFRKQSDPYGRTRVAGPLFYGVYMRLWTRYSGVIRLIAAEDALYVSVVFLFRIGHPPLCIPWPEIELSRTKYFFRRYVVLTLGRQEQIPMRISERMARRLGLIDKPALISTTMG